MMLAGERKLTKREVQVLDLLQLGKNDRQIALALGWSLRTAQDYVAGLRKKYGVTSRLALVLKVQKEPYDRFRAPRLA